MFRFKQNLISKSLYLAMFNQNCGNIWETFKHRVHFPGLYTISSLELCVLLSNEKQFKKLAITCLARLYLGELLYTYEKRHVQ